MSAVVFISYRRASSEDIAGRIEDRLRARLGARNVFRDVHTEPGAEFLKHFIATIERCAVFLVLVGPDFADRRIAEEGDVFRREIEQGLSRGKRVIPLLVGGASMPKRENLPESIRAVADLHAVPVPSGAGFDDAVKRLLELVDGRYRWRTPVIAVAALGVAAAIAVIGVGLVRRAIVPAATAEIHEPAAPVTIPRPPDHPSGASADPGGAAAVPANRAQNAQIGRGDFQPDEPLVQPDRRAPAPRASTRPRARGRAASAPAPAAGKSPSTGESRSDDVVPPPPPPPPLPPATATVTAPIDPYDRP